MVRQRVWRHLQHLAREQATTTIVTTHYVEEARWVPAILTHP